MTKHLLVLIFSLGSIAIFAQVNNEVPLDNSPFSRFGLGDLVNNNFAASSAFGGLSAAYSDAYHVNALNPAASCNLKSTAYEVGIFGKRSILDDNTNKAKIFSGHINYLSIGFPLRNQINELLDTRKKSKIRHGMNISLLPFSTVGYNIKAIQKIPNVDSIAYLYKGQGGTYKLMWGNSLGYKDFTFGLNLGYFFGSIKNDRALSFYNVKYGYDDDIRYNTRYGGFVWSIGTQYTYNIKKTVSGKLENTGKRIIIGAYGNSANNFKTSSSQLVRRINYNYFTTSAGGYHSDTLVSNKTSVKGNGKLPAEFAIGAIYEKENKLRVGINLVTTAWSQYQNDIQNDALKNAYNLSAGVEYVPEYNSYNKYYKRIKYRLGAHYAADPRVIKNEQIKTQGVTFGFGLPLIMPRQQTSFVDITFDVGKTGVSILSENYARVTLGFTLNDNSWFYKRKFN